jgi:hypothetical protein
MLLAVSALFAGCADLDNAGSAAKEQLEDAEESATFILE